MIYDLQRREVIEHIESISSTNGEAIWIVCSGIYDTSSGVEIKILFHKKIYFTTTERWTIFGHARIFALLNTAGHVLN